jgi:glycerophosphoryl diester phosphodiesterase
MSRFGLDFLNVGPQGPRGEPGPAGPKGDPGSAGATTFAELTGAPTDNAALAAALANLPAPGNSIDPRICAHRFGASVALENTLSAFRAMLAAGVRQFETDIQVTSDGALILHHDDTVDRMTDGTGAISAMTAAEIRELRVVPPAWFGNEVQYPPEPVPFLDDLLDAADERDIVVRLEVKNPAASLPLVAELNRRNWPKERVIVTSFLQAALTPAIAAGYPVGFIITDPSPISCAALKQIGIDYIDVGMDYATEAFVQRAHDAGLKVTAWTLIRRTEAATMFARGADFVTTDDPVWLAGLPTPSCRDPFALARRWPGFLETYTSGDRARTFANNGEFVESGSGFSGVLMSWGCPIPDPENWSLNFDCQINSWQDSGRHADVTVLQSDGWWADTAGSYSQIGFNVFERGNGSIELYRASVGTVVAVATYAGTALSLNTWYNYTLTVRREGDNIRITYRNNDTGNSVGTLMLRAHAGAYFYLSAGSGQDTVRFRNVRIDYGASPFRGDVILSIEGSAADKSPRQQTLTAVGGAQFVDGVATLGGSAGHFLTPDTDDFDLPGDFTIEFRARDATDGVSYYGPVLGEDAGGVALVAFENAAIDGRRVRMRSNSGVRADSGVIGAPAADFAEYCITRNGTVQTIYRDGVRLGTGAFDGVWQYKGRMRIGSVALEPATHHRIDLTRLRVTRACRYLGATYIVPESYDE